MMTMSSSRHQDRLALQRTLFEDARAPFVPDCIYHYSLINLEKGSQSHLVVSENDMQKQ